MTRRPAAPANLRNGLKWRDGRPRWEPSPANRACGFPGMDLRTVNGDWMDRGAAMSAADARTLWARFVREAMREDDAGGVARAMLRDALDRLPPMPADLDASHRRRLVADLIERGRAVIEDREPGVTAALSRAPRSVAAMVEGFLADREAQANLTLSSQRAYKTQSKRLVAKFGASRVEDVTRPQLRAWYLELLKVTSVASANQIVGVAGAIFKWATWQDPAWITQNPCTGLGKKKALGRRVFHEFAEEKAFTSWCDENGYADVADVYVVCLWTGARQIDPCAADLPDLSGSTWRYIPTKTQKRAQEALPGLLQPVKNRVERRRREAEADPVRVLNAIPFAWNPRTQRRHTSKSIGDLYREAKRAAVAAGALPATFLLKKLQDTRDTCVTRLFDAGVPLSKIPPWTGHSGRDAEDILREHYLILREHGALETAAILERYAEANGFDLAAS